MRRSGGLALVAALWAWERGWAVYNGLLGYVMVGVLFAGGWVVGRRLKAAHGHG